MTTITSRSFGQTADGQPVTCYTLQNGDFSAEILTYGGILRALTVPLADGSRRDVVLGCDKMADYEAQNAYLGAIIGRVANRIGAGRFSLQGREYHVPINNGPNCNHGGMRGFDQKLWTASPCNGALKLSMLSPDGDEGFPGALSVAVTYALTDDGALRIDYEADCDAPTPVNLSNHSYFNLEGHDFGDVLGHTLQIFSDRITENDESILPTGHLQCVASTPFDFRIPCKIGSRIHAAHEQLRVGAGYDHNYVLKTAHSENLNRIAVLSVDDLRMDCLSTQPGVQLYTANWLDNELGKNGVRYPRRSAVCLETQNWPNAVNQPTFPNSILHPGEHYHQTTIYRFY